MKREPKELAASATLLPEGYETGQDKIFEEERDPWVEIYAARQNHTILEGLVSAIEEHDLRGEKIPCLIIRLGYVKGLIPFQHTGVDDPKQLRKLIGQGVKFKVIGLDRDADLVVLSRKEALEQMAKFTWKQLEVGKKHLAVVRHAAFRYALVDLGGVVAKLPAEEISWGWVPDVRSILNPGDRFKVLITSLDAENQKVSVSLKQTLKCPWPEAATHYKEKSEYRGVVTGIPRDGYGVFVNLEPGVDALCPHARFIRPNPKDVVVIQIRKVDGEKHQIFGIIKKKLPR